MKTVILKLKFLIFLFCVIRCTSVVVPDICKDELQVARDVSYSLDVSPIIARSCAVPNCHVGSFPNGDFTFYEDLKTRADNGALQFRLTSGQMPPANSKTPGLTVCDVNIILQWVNEGASNN